MSRVFREGPPPAEANGALLLIHGRGAGAHDMLGLARHLEADDFHVVAPDAPGRSWYPYSFLAPVDQNEPGRTDGLEWISHLLGDLVREGIPSERVVLGGFSQGACLATEWASLNDVRLGGLLGFSGGLIGPPGTDYDRPGDLTGTPVFLGCSDVDPHIPKERVEETARVLGERNAQVDLRIYPGMGHTINADELQAARTLIRAVREAGNPDPATGA